MGVGVWMWVVVGARMVSMVERVTRQVGVVGLMVAAGVLCAGCASEGIEPAWGLAEGGGGGAVEVLTGERWAGRQYAAGEPREVRISPLTRVEIDERGEAVLTVHLELVDAWGHSGKWLMLVRVELSESQKSAGEAKDGAGGDGAGASVSANEARLDLDLTDPAVNAAAFDWITRTYVVRVKKLPTWATQRGAVGWVRAAVGWVEGSGERRVLRGAKQMSK